MRRRIPVIIAVVFVLCIAANTVLMFYGRSKTVHTGIEEFTDPEKIAQADITIEYIYTQNDVRTVEAVIGEEKNREFSEYDAASAILLVEPEGGVCQYQGSFAQNLTVKEVIKCDDPRVVSGGKIRIFRNWGMAYEDGKISCYTAEYMNIMYPGNTYLVFLDESKASLYADTPYFSLLTNTCSIINTDRTHALDTCPSYDFNDCADVLHFTASDKIAGIFASREEELLERYLP